MKANAIRLLLLVVCFGVGYWMVNSTTTQFLIGRDPAAIRQSYDFTHLRGSALEVAMKERTLAGLGFVREKDSVGVHLGHFALLNSAGEKTLACREYPKVILHFEAEGVVVNGERPRMEVEGGCEFNDDLTRIQPLHIPIERILGERPADGEFQFREGRPVAVRFSHLSDEWPRRWVLVGVKMTGRTEFSVDRNDVIKVLGRPALIQFD